MSGVKYWCGECNNCSIRDEYDVDCFYEIHQDWPRGEWTEETVFPESMRMVAAEFTWYEEHFDAAPPAPAVATDDAVKVDDKSVAE